jgi:hypothetical protein
VKNLSPMTQKSVCNRIGDGTILLLILYLSNRPSTDTVSVSMGLVEMEFTSVVEENSVLKR